MLFQIAMICRALLRPVLFTRILVNYTQDKPSFPKVLRRSFSPGQMLTSNRLFSAGITLAE